MAIPKDFPRTPFAILDPDCRWYPGKQLVKSMGYERLLPPLVYQLRKEVKNWRDSGYKGASKTSKSLLTWWFDTVHKSQLEGGNDFQYFFAQREAIETIIYLHEIAGIKTSKDLLRFTTNEDVSVGMLREDWQRYVIKMATGSGKTKVLSLALAWSYFHKFYEKNSTLSRNFLLIAPNIIVLDRIRKDFDGLKIFFEDPVVPDNGYDEKYWRDDFQLDVHIQDDVNITHKTGNIFVTNIHRVFIGNKKVPSPDDENSMEYFLGSKPVANTTDSTVDLGEIVRDIDELAILNDEAHHIHDEKLAWAKCILDIHNNLKQKNSGLSLQVDVTATPKHNDGSIFVQTVSDYPLVEAIAQDVVKHPILPDAPSRAKLKERKSIKYVDRFKDYIDLGVQEWKKVYEVNKKLGKKSVLFIMTDDTRNCDRVAKYLETFYQDLEGSVLTIHTKNNGEISESQTGKKKDVLDELRKQARDIDSWDSPYKVIVSVMMLKEGWDVRNVTTIVGLRAYVAKSNILPEQTLGRGLRRMNYFDATPDYQEGSPGDGSQQDDLLCVIGTKAFIDFIEEIKYEGVQLKYGAMDKASQALAPVVIEIERENEAKLIENLDIYFPITSPSIRRDLNDIKNLDVLDFEFKSVKLKHFSEEEQREIIFRDFETEKEAYRITLESPKDVDWTNVLGFFVRDIDRKFHMGGFLQTVLFSKMKIFIEKYLFTEEVCIEDPNVLRNLSENNVHKTLVETFETFMHEIINKKAESISVIENVKLSDTRAFRKTKNQKFIFRNPKKCAFNLIACDSGLEVEFAKLLDSCHDVSKWTYNYREQMNFKIDYIKTNGASANYYPDFIVVGTDGKQYIVETKGRVDIDVPEKMLRLAQWCSDINKIQKDVEFDYIYVDQKSFDKFRPNSLGELVDTFRQYKD